MKKISLKNLVYNKKFLVAASIIISIIFWFVAMIVRNPIRQQVFSDISANITVENTSAQSLGLGIVSDISGLKFSVTLSGPNYIVSNVKPEDFLLSASVAEVNAPGTYKLSVTGARNSDVTGYSFVSIDPPMVDVTFDYIDTKEFTVTPKVSGVSAADGLIVDSPIISNPSQDSITIKGPRTEMSKIKSVCALVEITKNKTLSSSQTYDADIVIYGDDDKILYRFSNDGTIYDSKNKKIDTTTLSLSFTNVKVTQPISKKVKLDVKPTISNNPSGVSIDTISWKLDHNRVTIIGAPDVVNKMTSVSLSAIDFREVSKSKSKFKVTPVLPEGVKILENIESFNVSVDVDGFAEKSLTVSNVKYVGISSNLSAKSEAIKNVKICGPKDIIKKITSKDLYAEVNVGEKTVGEHTVDVTVKSSKYTTVWQVGTYSLSVIIANK